MADATNTPPQDPVLQSQNRDAIIDEFNKSIGLGSNTAVDNPSNNYSPRPTAIDIYNKVVGNPIVGPILEQQEWIRKVLLQILEQRNLIKTV